MTKPKQDDDEQFRRFIELAKEREADQDDSKLKGAVRKLAAHPKTSAKAKRATRKG